MSNRSLAQPTAKPVGKPVGKGLLQRQGVSQENDGSAVGLCGENFDRGGCEGTIGLVVPAFPLDPPLPPKAKEGQQQLDHTFTRTNLHALPRNVHDDDPARAMATHWLLHELAPMLGLDPKKIEIQVNAAGGARIDARGASALQEDQTILLHPQRYRPDTEFGRYLLAHEITHAAQRRIDTPQSATLHTETIRVVAAEAEATELGHNFAQRRSVRRPRVALRRLIAAADIGENAEVKPAPPLAESVKTSRLRELALIRDALDGWWVSDGDVFTVMRILDTVSFPVAVAMVGVLPRDHRYWLCDNINPPHMYRHRRSVLASYQALEPNRFDAVDLKVMRALPDSGLDIGETDAARYVLNNIARDDFDELLLSEKGDTIAKLTNAPKPDPEKAKKIKAAADKAAVDEAALAEQRGRILAHAKDSAANDLITQIKSLLTVPRDGHGETRHPTSADAIAVLNRLSAERGDSDRFHYIAEELESAGLIDTLLQLLPPESFTGETNHDHALTLTALVESRLSIKNEQLLEDLLSYGLFDWAIRDYEALFAYRLIRGMPLASQYRFRQRDGGKWYLRLLDNLPRDEDGMRRPGIEIRKAASTEELAEMRKQGAMTEITHGDWRDPQDSYFYNASEIQEQRLNQGNARAQMDKLIAAFEEKRKGIYYDSEAKELYGELVKLGAGSLKPGMETSGDTALREAIIRELDYRGYIDELFGQLPDAFLYDQANRISTVKIMLSRDSMRVVAHARDLVSYGALDWLVWDSEAYLAFECIRALPDEERSTLIREQPELWKRIQSEMGPAMRQARDINAFVGDKAGTHRAGVLAELAEKDFWVAANEVALDGALRMAMAMSEYQFAFERSQEFDVVTTQPVLLPLIEKYRLYNPAQGRAVYQKEMLKGTRWHEEGVFSSLKSFWGGLVTLWNMDVLFVDGKIGAKIDLNNVQDFMGGDIMGAQLSDPAKRGGQQSATGPDANKLTLLMDPAWLDGAGKSAELILPQLLIDSTNVQLDGSTVQTREVDLRNLHIRAAYDGQNQGQATQAHVTLDSLVAHDLLYATNSAMYTMGKLVVETLRLAAGTIDTKTGSPQGDRKGRSIPFPLLVLAMLPWLVQMAAVALMATGIKKVRGLGDQGLEPDNRFKPDIASRTKAIDISFSKLEAVGFATSGGQRVTHAQIDNFAMGVGLNKATRLRAELASIERRKNALQSRTGDADAVKILEGLDKRRIELEGERKAVEAQETEYLAIQAKIRAGGLDVAQQRQLQQDLDRLDFEDKGGAFLDIGKIEASGIAGTVTSKEAIVLNNVHGEGSSSAMMGFLSGPTATPDELARRAAGERPPAVISKDRPADFTLELGNVHTGQFTVSGGVQSSKDIEKRLEDLKDVANRPEMKPLIESLEMLRSKAQRYEAMVAAGLSSLNQAQLEEFRGLRKLLTADAALIVESIDLTRARIDADLASGRMDLSAARAQISGLQLPQKGIAVEQIVASGIRAGSIPANGLLDWSEWKKNLRDADGKLDSLEIKNARSKYHGLLFEKATLTGAYADIKDRGNQIEAGLKSLSVEGLGLVPRLGLLNQRLQGLREKARVADAADKPALEQEIGKLSTLVDALQALADRRLSAYMRLEQAKTPDEIKAAKAEVAEVDATIAIDLVQYGAAKAQLDEFGVRVTGAGDILSDALGGGIDPLAVLERGGVTVTGTGPNHRLFKRLALNRAQTAGDTSDQHLSADVGAFEVGETRIDIHAKKEGDSLFVDVPQFEIDSVSLDQFLLTSLTGDSGYQIWSYGKSGIDKLSFSGRVRLDAKVPGSRDLSDYRLAHAHIDAFRIGSLYGNGLGFTLLGKKLELEIKSGSINGIHAEGVDVTLPEDPKAAPTITGKVGIDSIDKLVIGKAVAGAWSASGGRVDAKKIDVDLLQDGSIEASVGDLDLTDFSLRGPDGWVRFSLADLGGKVRYKDGALDIDDIHLGSLKLSAIHWKVGEKGFIEANKPSTVTNLKLKGRVETEQVPAKAEPGKAAEPDKTERKLSKLHIERLHIDKVESEHLLYQDEDNRIELKPADPTMQKRMMGFKPLFLQNLDVWGLDWTPKDNVTSGKVKLGTYEVSAHYDGLKSGLYAGIALKGEGMSAEMVGPDAFTIDVGKIEKTGGRFSNKKFVTDFGTGRIVGKVAIGPDYVEAQDFEINDFALDNLQYSDLPKILKLNWANIKKIKFGTIRQNYILSTDEKNKGEKIPSTFEVHDLELFDILARQLDYQGELRGEVEESGAKKEEVSTQHIKGDSVSISHIRIGSFERNDLENTSTLTDASIDTAPDAKPGTHPFQIKGLSADFISKVGSETTLKELTGEVNGGPLTASNIKFKTVVLGVDEKGEDVTRTEVTGGFTLNRLGFLNPDLTLTDKDGKTTRIHSTDGVSGSLEIAGIKPQFMANGTIALPIDSVVGKGLMVERGNMKVRLPLLEIKDIAMGLRGKDTDKGLEMLATKIREIHVQGMSIEIVKTHKAELTDEEFEAAKAEYKKEMEERKKNPPGNFIAEPLSDLQGQINGEYSLNNWEDPDIHAKIEGGVLSGHDLTNYGTWLQTEDVTRDGVTRPEDKVVLGRAAIDIVPFKRKLPGFYGGSFEPGSSGYINFRELVEGLVNEPGGPPSRTFEPTSELSNLIDFSGHISLGNGRLGIDATGDKKLGEGDNWVEFKRDKPGQNRFNLSARSIGYELGLDANELHFSGAGFTADKTQDGKTRIGKTGDITLQEMTVKIKGLADMELKITLEIKDGKINDIQIGDLTFVEAAELGKLAAPTLTDVNPKGVPKPAGGP